MARLWPRFFSDSFTIRAMANLIAVVTTRNNIRETVTFALRREGYEVVMFRDGQEAWDAF